MAVELLSCEGFTGDNSDGVLRKIKTYLGFDKKSSGAQVNLEITNAIHSGTVRNDHDTEINRSTDRGATSGDSDNSNQLNSTQYGSYVINLTPENGLAFTKDENGLQIQSRGQAESETVTRSYDVEGGLSPEMISLRPECVGQSKIKPGQDTDDDDDSDEYKFNHEKRGYMVQVINDDGTRSGADEDLRKMDEIRRKFGFECFNSDHKVNVTKEDMIRVLKQAQQADHTNCDCFLFMISCHGAAGSTDDEENYGLLFADEQIMYVEEIIAMFDDDHCPTLRGKPKLFFIQACRGPLLDNGNDISVIGVKNVEGYHTHTKNCHADYCQSTEWDKSTYTNVWANGDTKPFLHCENDMIVMFAATRGMMAWRNESIGSWLIHHLHEAFMDYDFAEPKSLLRVLTKVNRQISRRLTNTKNPEDDKKTIVPVIENKLTKDILF